MWYRRFWRWLHHPKRAVLAVYQEEWAERRKKAGKSTENPPTSTAGSWSEASKRYDWAARADAWDAHCEYIAQEYIERAHVEMCLGAVDAARRLLEIAASDDDQQARQAANSILDRIGLPRSTEQKHSGELTIFNLEDWKETRGERLNQVAQMPDSAGEGDEVNDT